MMKKFILIVCGSFVGAFLAFLFFMFAAMMMSIGIMGAMGSMGSKKSVNVSKHSILKLDLGTSIEERGGERLRHAQHAAVILTEHTAALVDGKIVAVGRRAKGGVDVIGYLLYHCVIVSL